VAVLLLLPLPIAVVLAVRRPLDGWRLSTVWSVATPFLIQPPDGDVPLLEPWQWCFWCPVILAAAWAVPPRAAAVVGALSLLVVLTLPGWSPWAPPLTFAPAASAWASRSSVMARRPLGRRPALALLAGGAAAVVLLVASGTVPPTAVGVPGAGRSNLDPPSVATIALALAQGGAAAHALPVLARGRGARVAAVGRTAYPVSCSTRSSSPRSGSAPCAWDPFPGCTTVPGRRGGWRPGSAGWECSGRSSTWRYGAGRRRGQFRVAWPRGPDPGRHDGCR